MKSELAWGIYELLAPVVVALLGWLSARFAGWIRARTANEAAAGMLVRLQASVVDAVKAVDQQQRELLERFRDPKSDGGAKLTVQEKAALKGEAMRYVRRYWGPKGIAELAKVLGFDNPEHLEGMMETKIEAAVRDMKRGIIENPS